ncbi:hypothetical protein BKA93DRAFT_455128 [Sparassis latifolia]
MSEKENVSNIVSGNTVPLTDPIYEFNVYELESFDPVLTAFTPTKFLGSSNGSLCTAGFDQLSFVQGVSSNLFNAANTSSSSLPDCSIYPLIEPLEKIIPGQGLELAVGPESDDACFRPEKQRLHFRIHRLAKCWCTYLVH